MNWMRLEGEQIRDSLLAISGQLQKSSGGPGAFVSLPEDVAGGFEFFKWFPSDEKQQAQRTIYTFQRRSVMNPMIEVFDGANMSEVCSRRSATVVPTQAFSLLNSDFTHNAAQALRASAWWSWPVRMWTSRWIWRFYPRWRGGRPSRSAANTRPRMPGKPAAESLASLGVVLFNLNEFLYLE